MYRFRSIENLIGDFQELENQEIYFAEMDQLNDPMEGERKYFWKGDAIVWENLFKHYILCLDEVITKYVFLSDNVELKKEHIPVFMNLEDLPTVEYKERIIKIYGLFFTNEFVKSYLPLLINNPNNIYSDELLVHLKVILPELMDVLFQVYYEYGFIRQPASFPKTHDSSFFDYSGFWDNVETNLNSTTIYQNIVQAFHQMINQFDFNFTYNFKGSKTMASILLDFPKLYVESLKQLVYPEAYVACFMDNYQDSSIWGTYGNKHEGVCLKFKLDSNNPIIELTSRLQSDTTLKLPFYKMTYTNELTELDFFRNMGRLTGKQLFKQWYSNDKGEISLCSQDITASKSNWRKQHWSLYEAAYLQKLTDWSNEREYRLILSSPFNDLEDSRNRILKYDFNDLEYIIFGMKTPTDDQQKIISIIEEKCKKEGRKEFVFYKMNYSSRTGRLEKQELYFI